MKHMILIIALAAHFSWALEAKETKAKVSFDTFKALVAEVEPHRKSRLIDLNTFLEMSKDPDVVILDSRSAFRYERIHLKGARHLAFADFTQQNLAEAIPSLDTKILIYCNNNFEGNQRDFATKAVFPRPRPGSALGQEFAAQKKPLTLALNIPTYINLYGYGYRNVYELNEFVRVSDPRIAFEGTTVKPIQESTSLRKSIVKGASENLP